LTKQPELDEFEQTKENKWRKHRLGELVNTIGGGTPKTDNEEYWEGDNLWLTPSEVSDEKRIHISNTERKLTDKGISNSSAKTLPPGSVLMTSRATVGVPVINREPMATNQGFIGIEITEENKLDNYYLLYWIKNNRSLIMNHASGSTYPEISQTSFNDLEINLPPIEEQEKIGSILRWLDEKREVNTDCTDSLEDFVQTLYKHWFIDFEPYEDFQDSPVGEIPEKFEVLQVSDLCDTRGGATPSTDEDEYWEGDNLWLTPKEVTALDTKIVFDTERKITQQGLDSCSTKIMPEKSVLLTSRATVGDVVVNREPMGTNQGFICIQPNDRVKPYYFSCLIENNRPEIESRASGSTYDEISQTSFNEIEVAVPPKEDIENFESKIEDIYEDIYTRELENRNLSSLKEALLPKLMSGEVRVNDINLEDLEVGSEV
jgi:type I restriction enzyme S subunit